MATIKIEKLRELFYKLFFIDYKDFVTNRQVCFGVLWDKKINKFVPYGNPYNLALTRYNSNCVESEDTINLDKLPKRDFSDQQIMNSVDCFFDIIGGQDDTIQYIYDLLYFVRDGGSKVDNALLKIEEAIPRLILDYFWSRSSCTNLTIEIKKTNDIFESLSLDKDAFFKGLEEHKYSFFDTISMIEALLGGKDSSYHKVAEFLHAVRKLRNSSAHSKNNQSAYNFNDASVLNRFRLYTLIVTVLYLQEKLKDEIPAYSADVCLTVQCMDEMSCDKIDVSLCNENSNVLNTARFSNGICTFSIKRYDKYKVKILETIDIEPTWSSLNPIVTYRSDGLHYYDNEFEAPASVRGAALKTVVELNEEVHEALISIASEVNQITGNTKPLHKIAEYVADLVNSRDDEKELIQQQTTILQNMQKLMESLVSNTSNPHNNWDAAIQQVGEIRKQGQEWADSIEKNRKHFDHKIDQISKWVLGAIFGFGIAIVCLLVFIVINMPIPSSEEDYPSSADELMAMGDSLLRKGNSVDAEKAYRKAIDAFYMRIANKENEEESRIKLARYFLNVAGNTEKAYNIMEPLVSDLKGHSEGALAIAEILFEKGDYNGVRTIIEDYKAIVNDSTPIVNRLEGVMRVYGYGGFPRDNEFGIRLLLKAADAGDMQAKYWVGRFFTEDTNEWSPIADRDKKSTINVASIDISSGVSFLQQASQTILKAAIELGRVYSDLNMLDSAEFYFSKVLGNAEKGQELHNQARYGMGLLYEKKGIQDNPYLRGLVVDKYKNAMLHSALKGDNPEAIIDIFNNVEYSGYRYLSPKAFAFLALGKRNEALDVLIAQHKNGGFTMDFIDGLAKLLGTKYVYQDSLQGMQLMQRAANSGCDFARMLCLYRNIEHRLTEKNQIELMDLFALEKMGEKIPFAYVLASFLFSKAGIMDRAQWAALKAMSKNHPAGAFAIISAHGDLPTSYFEQVWKDEGKSIMFYNAIQVALMKSPDKQKCIELSFLTDMARYNLHKISYPLWRLGFWTDVAVANNYLDLQYYLLNGWNHYDNSQPFVSDYKKKLSIAILNKLNLSKNTDQQHLETLESALNDLSSIVIDSLKEMFKGKVYALTMIDGRKHHEPFNTYTITGSSLNLILPIPINGLLFEFNSTTEKDKFSKYFETINSQEK